MGGARPPQYFTLETLLIFMHAVQIAAITVYITFSPPQNGIASYTYAYYITPFSLYCSGNIVNEAT